MRPDGNKSLASLAIDTEAAFGVEFGRFDNLNVFCPFCEDEETSSSPSCSVSRDGFFNCKACGMKGTASEFYIRRTGLTREKAKANLRASKERKGKKGKGKDGHTVPPLTEFTVEKCHQTLLTSSIELTYLQGPKRGLSMETIERFKIGCDEVRITIPIRNRDGSIYGMRRYLPGASTAPKMVKHEGGQGAPILFPIELLQSAAKSDQDYLILCEGEWDALLAIQMGFDAITVTSGVSTWSQEFTDAVVGAGKPVVIIYDVNDEDDDLGQRIAWQRAALLALAGADTKVVRLPLPASYRGGDITNWFASEGHSATELREIIDGTAWFDPEMITEETLTQQRVVSKTPIDMPEVMLHRAARSEYFYKMVRMRCLVAGKGTAPYLVPRRVSIEVETSEGTSHTFEHAFDAQDSIVLSMIQCTTPMQHRLIKQLLGIEHDTPAAVTVLEAMNIEEVYLIPAIDLEKEQGPYVLIRAYYIGHGLETNREYDLEAYTLPDPRTQAATHIITAASPSETDLDNFVLTQETGEKLAKVFQSDDVYTKMEAIGEQLANHITRIYGRNDLHIAVDLVFHSPLQFDFDGVRLRKGWLECLILGDTRTGKGCVTEGLVGHYGVGEVVSGENLSFAGLVGGIQKVGERNTLVWGKLPLNDKRLVVMDECGSLPLDTVGKLSRVRSEGVAEVTKIISEKTTSRTRLIWLSNPRPASEGSPRLMADYTFGVEAVAELIGAAEDVARFDFVLTVAQNEVASDIINSHHTKENIAELAYTSQLCRQLIVWAWSRQPEDIHFSDEATKLVLVAAKELGRQFCAKICLIQSEDIRFKLARIATAAACRTFSTQDYKTVLVNEQHVAFAYNFLHHIYSKPSCGYLQFSQQEQERSVIKEPERVLKILMGAKEGCDPIDLVNYLLDNRHISKSDMADATGLDTFQTQNITSALIMAKAITKDHAYYVKKPAFKTFLMRVKGMLTKDTHVTGADGDSTEGTTEE